MPQPPWDYRGDVPNPQPSFILPSSSPKPSGFILLKPHRKHARPAQPARTETLRHHSCGLGTRHVSFLAVGTAPLPDMIGGQQFPPTPLRRCYLQRHQVHYSYPKIAGSHARGSCQRELCCDYTKQIYSSMRYRRTSFLIEDAVPVFTEQGLCQEKVPVCTGECTPPLD